jgi:hypothetical protein
MRSNDRQSAFKGFSGILPHSAMKQTEIAFGVDKGLTYSVAG